MEGSGVEFEANDGKDEDGKGDKEANLKAENIWESPWNKNWVVMFLFKLVFHLHEWGKSLENGLQDNLQTWVGEIQH